MTKYAKGITLTCTIEDGESTRIYKSLKLASREVSKEGFAIAKASSPAFGAAMDAFKDGKDDIFEPSSSTYTEMMHYLGENLTEDHFARLEEKILGGILTCNKEEIEDWGDHFDKYPQDYLEVLYTLGKETFFSFFVQSTIVAPMMKQLKAHFQKLSNSLGDVQKTQETGSDEG